MSWQRVINESMTKKSCTLDGSVLNLEPLLPARCTDSEEAQKKILISEPVERDLRPVVVSEASEVIWRAIEAYMASTASMRGTRSSIRHLYEPHGPGKVRYTGPTAENILEDYLTGLGYERGSPLWFDFARVVIDHAEQQKTEQPEVAFWCKINEVPYEP